MHHFSTIVCSWVSVVWLLAIGAVAHGEDVCGKDCHLLDVGDHAGTSRPGDFAGFYFGMDAGVVWPRMSERNRSGIGNGAAFGLRLGGALWDQLAFEGGLGMFMFRDRAAITETVQTCWTVNNMPTGCGVSDEQSKITGFYLFAETGYQRRFRPWQSTSLLPGLHVGYMGVPGSMARGVGCDGCTELPLKQPSISGMYLEPFFRLTLGHDGLEAITARSLIFITGGLASLTTLSIEFLAP